MLPRVTTVEHADSQTFEAVVLLMLACGKLPDGELAQAEAQRVLELTRAYSEGLAEGYPEQVVREAAEKLAACDGPPALLALVERAAQHAAASLDEQAQAEVLDALRSIATADGTVEEEEHGFIEAVARTFTG